MSHYKHLTLSEREKLMYFLAKGYSMRQIAKELGRSASTMNSVRWYFILHCGLYPLEAQAGLSHHSSWDRQPGCPTQTCCLQA